MMQKSSGHGKLQMDERMAKQTYREAMDLSVYQVGVGDNRINLDGYNWFWQSYQDIRSEADGASVIFK